MVNRVDVRVNDVNEKEKEQLSELINDLQKENFQNKLQKNDGRQEYVVTVTPAQSHELKEALRVVLKIVTADRIAIDL